MARSIQVIVSPAKRMRTAGDGSGTDDVTPTGIGPFPEASAALARRLKAMDAGELQGLWRTSDRLTAACLGATERLEVPSSLEDARARGIAALLSPAALTYDGAQYRSMAPEVLDEGALAWLQGHLWILSGLHGCLRPLDAVMPYRLEMGARLSMSSRADGGPVTARNLYEFWGDAIARRITDEPGGVTVVNLASVEYADAILPRLGDETPVVTCIFGEELRAGKPVQRSTASKAARGSMVRWMAEHGVADPSELAGFDVGYALDEGLSKPGRLVFMRR